MSKFSIQNYTEAFWHLMPLGIAWNRVEDSVQSAVMMALARSYQKNDATAQGLLVGAFPATALDLLLEWEETLGLPDPCSISESDSIAIRQDAIVSKLTSTGGQSKSHFIERFKALGIEISIKEYRQARAGLSVAGDALNGDGWPFVWKVTAPDEFFKLAKAGRSYCGDPLRSGGNKVVECTLRRLSPLHTVYMIEFIEIRGDKA